MLLWLLKVIHRAATELSFVEFSELFKCAEKRGRWGKGRIAATCGVPLGPKMIKFYACVHTHTHNLTERSVPWRTCSSSSSLSPFSSCVRVSGALCATICGALLGCGAFMGGVCEGEVHLVLDVAKRSWPWPRVHELGCDKENCVN